MSMNSTLWVFEQNDNSLNDWIMTRCVGVKGKISWESSFWWDGNLKLLNLNPYWMILKSSNDWKPEKTLKRPHLKHSAKIIYLRNTMVSVVLPHNTQIPNTFIIFQIFFIILLPHVAIKFCTCLISHKIEELFSISRQFSTF